jgi:hypothetical protein
MNTAIQILNVLISSYSIIIAVLGTAGNILCFVICMRKTLREIPTFIFMSFLVLSDTLSLYSWNLNNFFITFYGLSIGDFNDASCKLTSFMQFFSNQTSAYLLVNKQKIS